MVAKPMHVPRFFKRVAILLVLTSGAMMCVTTFIVGKTSLKSDFIAPQLLMFHESNNATDRKELPCLSELANHQPNLSPATHTPEIIPMVETVQRQSILIFGGDRSGTTFLTRMFSEDPQIFAVYEPLWIPKRWKKFHREVYGNWENNVRDIVSALLTCHLSKSEAASIFLAHTNRKWAAGLFHNPFTAPPFCKKNATKCPLLPAKFAEKMCATNFKHSVVKVALVRVPDRKLSNLIPQILTENPDTDIKVLHVVRDPRGSVNSRINARWIPDYTAKGFPKFVRDACDGITSNIRFGQSLKGWLKDRYRLVRYKDLAGTPLKTAQELYDFARFEMPESLKDWIEQSTNPSKEKLAKESKKPYSTVRNSTANIQKWRQESSIERNRIIQRECSELFDLLELDRI